MSYPNLAEAGKSALPDMTHGLLTHTPRLSLQQKCVCLRGRAAQAQAKRTSARGWPEPWETPK